ncbi:MAG: amidohydrolase family protein, partial [Synergistaceae bacterium]|nr:amidohydrolase family protein [Synergistaceae bacterium]
DGKILEIGDGAAPTSGLFEEKIDCRGMILMPGLIDAHIHATSYQNNSVEKARTYYPGMRYMKAFKILEDTLYQGFTTVRDCGGADAGFREAIAEGLAAGPRMTVSGHILTMTGGHADHRLSCEIRGPIDDPFEGVVCDGADEVRKAAREQLRRGVDHVKLMTGGGCSSESDEPESAQFSLGEIRAAVEEANAAGRDTIGHCYSNRSMTLCAEAGVYSIEHGNFLNQETANFIKEKGAWLVPTLATYDVLSTKGEELGFPGYFARKAKNVAETAMEALEIAYKTGLKIASGSDLVGVCQPFKGLEIELKARVMGAMDAIMAATKSNAELLKKSDRIGTIEPEKFADIIVVDGDPLRNPGVFKDRGKIRLIMKGGILFKNEI